MKTLLLLCSGAACGALGVDLLLFASPLMEPVRLESQVELRVSLERGSLEIGGFELPPEEVLQGYDEYSLGGDLWLELRLRAMRESGEERSLWLEAFEHSGEAREVLAGLELEQGVRFRRGDDWKWSGVAIDADGERLKQDVRHALANEAFFEALLGDSEVEVGQEWEVQLTPAEAFGLLLPGVGVAGLAELLPEGVANSERPSLRDALRESAVEVLEAMEAELVVECRYESREDDLARLVYSGEWRMALDLGAALRNSVQDTGDWELSERDAGGVFDLEPEGTLVWDLRNCVPVEHTLETEWTFDLLVEAIWCDDDWEVPATAEFSWEGSLESSSTCE